MSSASQPAIEQLVQMVDAAVSIAVLTGAGVSTASGLPDYRGSAGLWRNRRFEELASIEAFRNDTEEFWQFYDERLAVLAHAQPNPAHRAIAALEHGGAIERVITQNVDGLHRRAGSDPVELHGTLERARCVVCGLVVEVQELDERRGAGGVPLCPCGEPMKPDVVLFGELLPMDAVQTAAAIVERCDLLVVAGTSLAVVPAAGFAHHAAERGARVAIINDAQTSADGIAHVRVRGRVEQVLPELARRVLGQTAL